MDLGLVGKSCAVTGASRGIGRETARMLCAEGADVLLVARGANDLGDAVDECRAIATSSGGHAEGLALDVTDDDAGERLVAAATDRSSRLDVLVNNAGTAARRPLERATDEDFTAAFELNVIAPLRAMRAAMPAMRERGWGRIVNVASSAGKRPSPQMPDYSVAKAAELSLSRLFADVYAESGVLVNAVCPGPTLSELWVDEGGLADQQSELSGKSRDEILEATAGGRPIGRMAEVSEIAAAIVFLCSERASYVAGAAWSVDGGTVQVIL
jgi:NAD(P)-dependent dehydrogenase (short-subunit alcohol dehydrogenase family)